MRADGQTSPRPAPAALSCVRRGVDRQVRSSVVVRVDACPAHVLGNRSRRVITHGPCPRSLHRSARPAQLSCHLTSRPVRMLRPERQEPSPLRGQGDSRVEDRPRTSSLAGAALVGDFGLRHIRVQSRPCRHGVRVDSQLRGNRLQTVSSDGNVQLILRTQERWRWGPDRTAGHPEVPLQGSRDLVLTHRTQTTNGLEVRQLPVGEIDRMPNASLGKSSSEPSAQPEVPHQKGHRIGHETRAYGDTKVDRRLPGVLADAGAAACALPLLLDVDVEHV
jgi:hypothetical protein